MTRREFLALATCAARLTAQAKPDVTLRIAPVDLEIAPKKIIHTMGYNGSVPGPILRWREGRTVTVEVHNETGAPELVHWHGLFIPPEVDGSMEEGTPMVAAHGTRTYTFTPRPSGTRWYHSHTGAGRNLKRATYSGQFGILYIEPPGDPGHFDAEIFLSLHGWDGYLGTAGGEEGMLEVVYTSYSINDRALGHGDPIRVKEGRRVLFRILNANATMSHRLALPGHQFLVTALDGNPVPNPRAVDVLELGPAERVDAVVLMNQPGVWILGEVDANVRNAGLGIVVEYPNHSGLPQWADPPKAAWNYTQFGKPPAADSPDIEAIEIVPLVFRRKFAGNRWVDHWTINGKSYPKTDPIRVRRGHRYRLRFDNQSDDPHPVHLHRHSFELINIAGVQTAGIVKDVVVVPARRQVDVHFTADNPGSTLFHCHQQLHMDFGFMTMLEYEA